MLSMMRPDAVYALPTWLLAVLVVGVSAVGAALVELLARHLFPHRRAHNDVAAAMFSVIGVTFAVLLAFVTMLSLETFNGARLAVANEAMVTRDVLAAATGLRPPAPERVRAAATRYLDAVVRQEWPEQVQGRPGQAGTAALGELTASAAAYVPDGAGDANLHASLLAAVTRLRDARMVRQSAAAYGVPGLVWLILIAGGSLTVVSGSFLGAPSRSWHMVMSATLAASGAIVVVMLIVLSEPFRGASPIPPTPFLDVLQGMQAP